MSDELEQVGAVNRALPFAEGIAQGNTLRRDQVEATFMNYRKSAWAFKWGAKNYYAMMAEYDALR